MSRRPYSKRRWFISVVTFSAYSFDGAYLMGPFDSRREAQEVAEQLERGTEGQAVGHQASVVSHSQARRMFGPEAVDRLLA